jgi:hypothetical protein
MPLALLGGGRTNVCCSSACLPLKAGTSQAKPSVATGTELDSSLPVLAIPYHTLRPHSVFPFFT